MVRDGLYDHNNCILFYDPVISHPWVARDLPARETAHKFTHTHIHSAHTPEDAPVISAALTSPSLPALWFPKGGREWNQRGAMERSGRLECLLSSTFPLQLYSPLCPSKTLPFRPLLPSCLGHLCNATSPTFFKSYHLFGRPCDTISC